ncbi:hypothetical protein HK405_013505 [Cladochytrium tenue]|nr:hypothetical protein HK405_013505 [Cladochytrium tenue]
MSTATLGGAPTNDVPTDDLAAPAVVTARPLTQRAFAAYGDVVAAHDNRLLSRERSSTDRDPAKSANMGTARRLDWLSPLANLRAPSSDAAALPVTSDAAATPAEPDATIMDPPAMLEPQRTWMPPAVPNICVFRSVPTDTLPFPVRLLERHPYSSQLFVPMTRQVTASAARWPGPPRYLVVVAPHAPGRPDLPDFSRLDAFVADSNQAVNYAPGTWHHPLIALHPALTDFACIVCERGPHQEHPDEDCHVVRADSDHPDRPGALVQLPGPVVDGDVTQPPRPEPALGPASPKRPRCS